MPALALAVCMAAAVHAVGVKRGHPVEQSPDWSGMWRAAPVLLIVVIILAGILSCIFPVTEAAAIAVIYSILLAFFLYRTLIAALIPRIYLVPAATLAVLPHRLSGGPDRERSSKSTPTLEEQACLP